MLVDLEYDYDAATKSMDGFSQNDINYLREWTQKLDKSKYVPKDLTDKQLLLFYHACYGDIDKTKACIERYYSCRKNTPDFFDNRAVYSEEMRPMSEALEFAIMPGKSCDGYDIIFHRLRYTEPSKYNFELGCRMFFMTIDAYLHKRGPQPGLVFLFDMRGVKLGHIARCGLSSIRKFFQYIQEAIPVRMKAIHVMNTEPVVDKLMIVIKPFMDKRFFDMLKFHHKDEDLEKFHATIIPKSELPPDYGGTLPDSQTLHAKCMQTLHSLQPYFNAEEAQRIAALPDKKRDKMEKAFKNLDID